MRDTLTRIVRTGEIACFAVLFLAGLYAVVMGLGYGVTNDDGLVGGGMVPTGAGLVLTALGGYLLVTALRGEEAPRAERDETPDIHGRTESQRVRHLWQVFGLLLVTILLVEPLGFITAFSAFLLVVATIIEKRSFLGSLLMVVIGAATVYVLFVQLLRVPLPTGPLGL
ncbi:MAG: tripartite tricarboxylate transporter TctB family protein [Actinomycetota bacterium]|nr:tripartite tricarboxylate transporter TctB family protein [Actinomycetota bacterium]